MKFNKKDFKVEFTKGSGPGGQHRNKVETACKITHVPTGLIQNCQSSRSKTTNLETAMRMLVSKLTQLENDKKHNQLNSLRKAAVDSETIRTYNFTRNQVKDHRTGKTADLSKVLDGKVDFLELSV